MINGDSRAALEDLLRGLIEKPIDESFSERVMPVLEKVRSASIATQGEIRSLSDVLVFVRDEVEKVSEEMPLGFGEVKEVKQKLDEVLSKIISSQASISSSVTGINQAIQSLGESAGEAIASASGKELSALSRLSEHAVTVERMMLERIQTLSAKLDQQETLISSHVDRRIKTVLTVSVLTLAIVMFGFGIFVATTYLR